MRTNIIIDDFLMEEAISISNCRTKKEVVEKALQLLIAVSKQQNITKFKGKLSWFGDLEESRKD
jgi:Arc/MetJ family transcription regulator